jgi:hypothetical protein
MKPAIFLKISSILLVLHAVGHTIGMASWNKGSTSEQQFVIRVMTDRHFPFMGATRSFADSFNGFGNIATVSLLLMAAMLWIIGSFAAPYLLVAKKLVWALFIALFLQSILEFIYFFPAAAIMTLLAALLTGVSLLRIKKGTN